MDRRDGEILGNETAITIRDLQERREAVLMGWLAGEYSPQTAQTRIRWLTKMIERIAEKENTLSQPIRA